MTYSFNNNKNLKDSIIEQLEIQRREGVLSTIKINRTPYEIYGTSIQRPQIDHSGLADALGIPRQLLILSLPYPDWCGYREENEAIFGTIGDYIEFFQAIPVGKDLSLVLPEFLIWLMNERTFGAARFAAELGTLLPQTVRQLNSPADSEQLLSQLVELQLKCENRYGELYDTDTACAIRCGRAAQVAEFMQSAIEAVQNRCYLDLLQIESWLCMGIQFVGEDQDSFAISEQIKEKLYALMLSQ